MRGFIVLCLVAVGMAVPQGYNYNPSGGGLQQHSGFGANLGTFGGSSNVVGVSSGGSGIYHGDQSAQQGFFNQGISTGVGHHQATQQQHHQPQAIISKRFYIHSAPEDAEEDYKEKHITVGVPKKNYNVVFIKAPAKSHKKTSIKITPAVNEEKTVIYVLSKKSDSSDVHAEVIEHATATTKPEVFFIKYKTAEEAAHAQQQIQSQYDALGGSSQITDEGVAPVTSVIGSLGGDSGPGAATGGSFTSGSVSSGVSSHGVVSTGSHAGNAYLPPNF